MKCPNCGLFLVFSKEIEREIDCGLEMTMGYCPDCDYPLKVPKLEGAWWCRIAFDDGTEAVCHPDAYEEHFEEMRIKLKE